MQTVQRQIAGLLRHLKLKPGDRQARDKLYSLGYHEPKPGVTLAGFDELLKKHYSPANVVSLAYSRYPLLWAPKDADLNKPAAVFFPKDDENARRLGYGVAYVVMHKQRE